MYRLFVYCLITVFAINATGCVSIKTVYEKNQTEELSRKIMSQHVSIGDIITITLKTSKTIKLKVLNIEEDKIFGSSPGAEINALIDEPASYNNQIVSYKYSDIERIVNKKTNEESNDFLIAVVGVWAGIFIVFIISQLKHPFR